MNFTVDIWRYGSDIETTFRNDSTDKFGINEHRYHISIIPVVYQRKNATETLKPNPHGNARLEPAEEIEDVVMSEDNSSTANIATEDRDVLLGSQPQGMQTRNNDLCSSETAKVQINCKWYRLDDSSSSSVGNPPKRTAVPSYKKVKG
uniref:Uncharacterized protein n=1 Tax=Glossina austeni TaxID=7395 RepID=A0A1A9USG5_GLOAU